MGQSKIKFLFIFFILFSFFLTSGCSVLNSLMGQKDEEEEESSGDTSGGDEGGEEVEPEKPSVVNIVGGSFSEDVGVVSTGGEHYTAVHSVGGFYTGDEE